MNDSVKYCCPSCQAEYYDRELYHAHIIECVGKDFKSIRQLCNTYDEFGTIFDEDKLPPLAERVAGIIGELLNKSAGVEK